MLLEIKNYLQTHSKVSLHELSGHFHVPPEVILPMVTIWIDKGKVRKCSQASHCGVKCFQCRPSSIAWFEWVRKEDE